MEINYRCDYCKLLNIINVKEEFNLTKNQKLYEKINDDSLFLRTCEACGEVNTVLFPALFVDDDYKFLIKLDNETKEDKVLIRTKEYEYYKIRIVNNLNDLKEKMRIYYSFLDDVVIEIIKKIFTEHFKEENLKFDYIAFHRIVDKTKLSFVVLNGDAVNTITYDIEGYNKIYYKLKTNEEFNTLQYVNQNTINSLFEALNK